MTPPTAPLNLDIDAVSGICGSISIACWVVVFSPQIIENFRRRAADGLSLHFVMIWLLGDVFNILGAVMQGVLPTMIILAIYYTIADVVLLGQCFYYRGFTWKDEAVPPPPKKKKTLASGESRRQPNGNGIGPDERTSLLERRGSDWSDRLIHVNPVVPIVEPSAAPAPPATRLQAIVWNTVSVIMVIGAGVAGWALSRGYSSGEGERHKGPEAIRFDLWGQIFGYFCAALYLGSRLPQLLLNYRRKSTEGLSMLFFLFACLGNLTYALSIFAFDPKCYEAHTGCQPGEARRIYGQNILVNLSWLAGSVGTLLLDMGVFIQFFLYNKDDGENDGATDDGDEDDERSIDGERWDQRPILQRNQSEWST
ncbi:vacuolar membrane transporter [Cytospora paraplurivora]|uniref:Vacuolar membrane transporter n=1 Tax=Cytospora paraplurivora TaxID=2898453 RepID=A0AAN9U2E7_9PEZI